MNITLLQSEYYRKAIDSIPKEHTHRDEIVSLLIDQVIDDFQWQHNSRLTSNLSSNENK